MIVTEHTAFMIDVHFVSVGSEYRVGSLLTNYTNLSMIRYKDKSCVYTYGEIVN